MQILLIGAAARAIGINADTLRKYCRWGLLSPVRDSAGQRVFAEDDLIKAKAVYRRSQHKCQAKELPV